MLPTKVARRLMGPPWQRAMRLYHVPTALRLRHSQTYVAPSGQQTQIGAMLPRHTINNSVEPAASLAQSGEWGPTSPTGR